MVRTRREGKLLGLGLDNEDGHVRITRAGNYELYGGSAQTHELMQEKCAKFDEKLNAKGKELGELHREEFLELAAECEMNVMVRKQEGD